MSAKKKDFAHCTPVDSSLRSKVYLVQSLQALPLHSLLCTVNGSSCMSITNVSIDRIGTDSRGISSETYSILAWQNLVFAVGL